MNDNFRARPSTCSLTVLLLLVSALLSPAVASGRGEVRPERLDKSPLLVVMGILDGVSANEETEASPFRPPGFGGTPPGQGGTPPGQTTPPGQGESPPPGSDNEPRNG